MNGWKSCENCINGPTAEACKVVEYYNPGRKEISWCWYRIPCPRCGGALSTTREHNGRKYRHCYACHSEFFINEGDEK